MTELSDAQERCGVVLRDGQTVVIRALGLQDAEALQRFHVGQSDESTYQRFFAPRPRLSESDLLYLLDVDQSMRVALCVTEKRGGEEVIVAVGRFDRYGVDAAELACTVADPDHGRGIASLLLKCLVRIGSDRGVRRLTADVLAYNTAMIGFLRHTGYPIATEREDDVMHVEIILDEATDPTR